MRTRFVFLLTTVAYAQSLAPVDPALAEIANTRRFLEAVVSPDGSRVAYVEAQGNAGKSAIYAGRIAGAAGAAATPTRITAGDGKAFHDEHGVAWSPDSRQIAFLSDREKKDQLQLYIAGTDGGAGAPADAS